MMARLDIEMIESTINLFLKLDFCIICESSSCAILSNIYGEMVLIPKKGG